MKRALRTWPALGFALAALLSACERVEVQNSTLPDDPKQNDPNASLSELSGQSQTLIQRISVAREHTVFQGVRHVELNFEENGVQRHVDMRERVSADGQGGYAIEAVEVLDPPMNQSQQDVFVALQTLRQGMNWRYRDFSIHSPSLFLLNYTLVDTGNQSVIAGRNVEELSIGRTDQSGSLYTLHVDLGNGLIMKAREESREGTVISEMTYESFSLQPDLSNVVWHQSLNDEQYLPAVGRIGAQVGFEPRSPHVLPAGFQLLGRTRLTDPLDGSLWVKCTYTDGIENLFFLHGGPIVNANGINSGVPLIQADLVEVTVAAPWTIARGNLRGERVMALGKVPEADLLLLLRSAMQ